MRFSYDQIAQYNEHWTQGTFYFHSYPIERSIFSDLKKHLSSRFILTLQGLRRTGKSVLQEQLVAALISSKPSMSTTHYLRFSFENDDTLLRIPSGELRELLNYYFREVLQVPPRRLKDLVVISLDEIQNVENWQVVVKSFYDLNPNLKFIVTGSSSLYFQDTSESLVGRAIDFEVPPLDFEELFPLVCDPQRRSA